MLRWATPGQFHGVYSSGTNIVPNFPKKAPVPPAVCSEQGGVSRFWGLVLFRDELHRHGVQRREEAAPWTRRALTRWRNRSPVPGGPAAGGGRHQRPGLGHPGKPGPALGNLGAGRALFCGTGRSCFQGTGEQPSFGEPGGPGPAVFPDLWPVCVQPRGGAAPGVRVVGGRLPGRGLRDGGGGGREGQEPAGCDQPGVPHPQGAAGLRRLPVPGGGGLFRRVLLVGEPGSGKTTLLRDAVRSLSWGKFSPCRRVAVLDQRGGAGSLRPGARGRPAPGVP